MDGTLNLKKFKKSLVMKDLTTTIIHFTFIFFWRFFEQPIIFPVFGILVRLCLGPSA